MNNILKIIRIAVFTTLGLVLIMTFGCELAGDDNSKPISNAGLDQIVKIGTLVTLDGNGSDDDGDDLIFSWSFDEIPLGSSATLSDVSIINPTFTIDKEGLYIVNLTVFDGSENSAIDIVTIFADPWTTKSPMPTARQSFATSVVNGKIYAIGGAYTVSIPNVSFTYYDVPIVEEYDPATDTWTVKSPMPKSRAVLTSSSVNGKIYTFGGSSGGVWGTILSTVEEYDPATDTWTVKSPMPVSRSWITSSVVNGKIYIFGGRATADRNRVDEYDPATDNWSVKSNRPSNGYGAVSCTLNDKIYLIGGDSPNEDLRVEEYDPANDTWAVKTSTPTERAYLGVAAVNWKIYSMGGIGMTYYSTLEEYDPATDTWTTKISMPTTYRSQLAVGVVNDKIYVIGGEDGSGSLSLVEEYEPN